MLYPALRIAFALSRHVSQTWRGRLGALGGDAFYWLAPAKRRNTVRNMAIVLGDGGDDGGYGGRRAKAAARASARNYGRYVTDFFNLPNVPLAEIVRHARVEGWEHLDRALEAGKGVIFAGGHVGLWDYAPAVIADRYPGRIYVVAEPFTSPQVEALIQGQRAAQGSTVIPMTNVRAMARALKGNNIVVLLVDRPVAGDGVTVDFFGRPTTVPAGAATLAALTGAAILPGYFRRRPDGDFEGGVLPPIVAHKTGDRAADVQRTTQDVFAALERIIRRGPAHWYMFRDMWGTALTPHPTRIGLPALAAGRQPNHADWSLGSSDPTAQPTLPDAGEGERAAVDTRSEGGRAIIDSAPSRGSSPLPRTGECAGPSAAAEGPVSHGSGVRAAR